MSDSISLLWRNTPLRLLLVLFALAWGSWQMPLYDYDEGAFTEATREMLAGGNYVSIGMNGEPRHDKPIMTYWLQGAAISLFGLNEFGARAASVVAAFLWALVLYRFARRHLDEETGQVAMLVMALALYVGVIGKAAVADAVLNLFMVLAFFGIHEYRQRPRAATLRWVFVWLGLGWLTKGPVAVFFPFLVSGLLYVLEGRWRDWLRLVFDPAGLAIFFAIVLPWHLAVYLDTGWAFFEGFYLHHNLDRYSDEFNGHGGGIFYYVIAAPLILMPFAGWLMRLLGRLPSLWRDDLDRLMWLWFLSVLVFFSFSGTKLPHYLLYGATPLFVLLARYREDLNSRLLAYLPVLLFFGLLFALPWIFGYLSEQSSRAYEQTVFALGAEQFGTGYLVTVAAAMAIVLWLLVSRGLRPWQGLLLAGVLQAVIVSGFVLPRTLEAMQGPVKRAALQAAEQGRQMVFYGFAQPSASVYARQVIPRRKPLRGEWLLVRNDYLPRLEKEWPDLSRRLVFSEGALRVYQID